MEVNWPMRKILVQIHHMSELRKSKIVLQFLDLCDNSPTTLLFMLKFFQNELYSTTDDSQKLIGHQKWKQTGKRGICWSEFIIRMSTENANLFINILIYVTILGFFMRKMLGFSHNEYIPLMKTIRKQLDGKWKLTSECGRYWRKDIIRTSAGRAILIIKILIYVTSLLLLCINAQVFSK